MKVDKATVDEFNKDYDNVYQFTSEALPYLLHGFIKAVEDRELYSFSIQSTSDGTIRTVLRAWDRSEPKRVSGVISYGNFDSIPEAVASIETGLAYDALSWREDKYAKQKESDELKTKLKKKVQIDK